jgi:hypothetical protein
LLSQSHHRVHSLAVAFRANWKGDMPRCNSRGALVGYVLAARYAGTPEGADLGMPAGDIET